MKIDRLLGIITVLTTKKKVKAKELAERFEVSIRTIHRDIETISKAGIPIVTYSGGDGGIGIVDGFTMDKNALSREEMNAIILGLKSLDTVMADSRIRALLYKLSADCETIVSLKDDMLIDLSSFYKNSLAPKIATLRKAVAERKLVSFCYYSKTGKTTRTIEPYLIAFKWSAWYIYGYCRLRADFRLFKLNRLTSLVVLDESYTFRELTQDNMDLGAFYKNPDTLSFATIRLDKSLEYIAIDSYGVDSYRVVDENTIEMQWDYVNEYEMVKIILSLGGKAKVIAPDKLVKAVQTEIEKIREHYP